MNPGQVTALCPKAEETMKLNPKGGLTNGLGTATV